MAVTSTAAAVEAERLTHSALHARIRELEAKLAQCAAECEAEARKASEAALERAAIQAEATGEELERLGANNGYGGTFAADIRALKRGGA